jgi:hypothetical protein
MRDVCSPARPLQSFLRGLLNETHVVYNRVGFRSCCLRGGLWRVFNVNINGNIGAGSTADCSTVTSTVGPTTTVMRIDFDTVNPSRL